MKSVDIFAEFRIRTARGQNLFGELKNALLITASLKIILVLTTFQSILLGFLCIIGFYAIGYLDLNWFKLYQAESKLNTQKYNPHLRDIVKKSDLPRKRKV